MVDDPKRRQPDDPRHINVNEAWEVDYWSTQFNVTPEQLKQTVRQVGTMTEKIRQALGK